tara:strand:- start:775 stop:1257 length:483 start_codon:yes stop_codon:yes gene_type:complete
VGSTTDFAKRKNCHKSHCNNENGRDYNVYVYQFIRENGNWDNFDMLEIEKYKAIDKPDQLRRERYWLEYYSATLNIQIPSRSVKECKKQYREQNREQIIEKKKKYYEENKEKFIEYLKEYREQNREQIIEKKKKYYEENREKISEERRQRRKQNKLNEKT